MMKSNSFQETLSDPTKGKLIKQIEDKIESMKKNHVWDSINLPPRRKAIENKWTLEINGKKDDSIKLYKAHLVDKGTYNKRVLIMKIIPLQL